MRNLILNNFFLKVSAVLLSVFLWFFLTSRGQSEMSIEIPIEFRNVPAGLGIASTDARTVNITIRGQERLMKNVKTSDIRVFVDLSRAKKGEGIYYINKDDITLPYAMSVMNITPSSVRIRIEEAVSKTVLVKASMTGIPEKGYYVKSIEVEPRRIVIYGLRSEVEKINMLKTEVLDITGLSESISQEVSIDFAGANIKSDTGSVLVTIVISGRDT
jgi:YbbR domain-containing protein